MLLPSTTRTLTSPLKSSFTGANAHAPPKQLSSLTNRNHLAPSSTSARMTATPQTSLMLSTPVIHSTGKPLKHSLMSTHSSPHVRPGVRLHHRAQSEPATPARGSVKNVLFAGEESLSTVRVFNASGKPVNGSKRQAADDTETETKYNSSSVPNKPTSFPFLIMGLSSSESDTAFQLDFMRCSSVPSTNLAWYVNVFETGHSTLHRPSEARLRRRPQAASTLRPHTITIPPEMKNTMSSFIGEMPATTAPTYDYTLPPSTNAS